MASIRPATRYTNSSTKSDPSSSTEFTYSRALTKKDATGVNFGSMVKKLVDNKKAGNFNKDPKFVVAADFLVEDLKKNGKRGAGLSGLHKKLFKGSAGGAKRGEESARKALAEVKGNTRTLAMVLRSERELLITNKEQEEQIAELKLLIEEKSREVEKLKDLCLKQREEITSLKSAVLFPDVMKSDLQDIMEKQGSELKQAKQLIPSLQRQVTSLTGQLKCLAKDLAEVKADKYSGRGFFDNHFSTPQTASYDREDGTNSPFDQEFSSGDYTTPGSPDNMFLKDLNPCLTPDKKSQRFDGYDSSVDGGFCRSNTRSSCDTGFNPCDAKLPKGSNCRRPSSAGNGSFRAGNGLARGARRSDESKYPYGKQTNHKVF